MEIILASRSPRRRVLLKTIVRRFTILGSRVKEQGRRGETPRAYCLRVAEAKARDVQMRLGQDRRASSIVIGADTIVVIGQRVLGQPRDRKAARKMLAQLSGRRHHVLTAVVLCGPGRRVRRFIERSDVWFRVLSEREVDRYVASGEPLDKAGAYAIQGRGGVLVKRYTGSLSNIIGLPLERLGREISSITRRMEARHSHTT